jgi:hypothetical protein
MHIVNRQLAFGPYQRASTDSNSGAQPYVIAGRKLYVLGFASGELGPIGTEHLVGRMGGIWCHPVRVGDGLSVTVVNTPPSDPVPANFIEDLGGVQWDWHVGPLAVQRHDYVPANEPGLVCRVQVANNGPAPHSGQLRLTLPLSFSGAWFSGIPTGAATYHLARNLLLGQDGIQTDWQIAFGAVVAPDACTLMPRDADTLAELTYGFTLAPGATANWRFVLAVSHSGAAATLWQRLAHAEVALVAPDRFMLEGLPRLSSADIALNNYVALAQANLDLLQTDNPIIGAYFLAGLPEYPQLFGCDTTYSIPGAVAGGFAATARSALAQLANYAERACGRIPHEITTNGRVFNPGNIQETPQYTIAVCDYLRWSGDLDFARKVFPLCREGMLELLPAYSAGGPYPYGDGMIERLGMGSRKLDAACYTITGLRALADLAEWLGEPDAATYRERANAIHAAFERDWWIAAEGLYADSLHSDDRPQLDGHWTVVLPVQLGLAAPERARRVLERINAEFVNEWGLVHTRKTEELVWTLPTGLLALAEFAHGRPANGLHLARRIAETTEHGTPGTFKELIPQGLCYVQLWSAALYLQIIFEGLLGLQPNAPAHELGITPALSADQLPLLLHNLQVGAHSLSLTYSADGIVLDHHDGPQALTVHYAGTTYRSTPGGRISLTV